jgi:hypothetical protein
MQMHHETNQQQVQVNTDEGAIRADLGKQLGESLVKVAVLSEQVQALAVDKMQLEEQVRQLQSMLEPKESYEAAAPEVIDAPIAE